MDINLRKIWLIKRLQSYGIDDNDLFDKIMNGSANYLKSKIKKYKHIQRNTHIKKFEIAYAYYKDKYAIFSMRKGFLLRYIDYFLKEFYAGNKNSKEWNGFILSVTQFFNKKINYLYEHRLKELKETAGTNDKIENVKNRIDRLKGLRREIINKFKPNLEQQKNSVKRTAGKSYDYEYSAIRELIDWLSYGKFLNEIEEVNCFGSFKEHPYRINQRVKGKLSEMNSWKRSKKMIRLFTQFLKEHNITYEYKEQNLQSVSYMKGRNMEYRYSVQKTKGTIIDKELDRIRELKRRLKQLHNSKFSDKIHIKRRIKEYNKEIAENKKLQTKKLDNGFYEKLMEMFKLFGDYSENKAYQMLHQISQRYTQELLKNEFGKQDLSDTDKKYNRSMRDNLNFYNTEEFKQKDYLMFSVYIRSDKLQAERKYEEVYDPNKKSYPKLRREKKSTVKPYGFYNWKNYIQDTYTYLGKFKRKIKETEANYVKHKGKPLTTLFYSVQLPKHTEHQILKAKYNLYAKVINKYLDSDMKIDLLGDDVQLVNENRILPNKEITKIDYFDYRERKDKVATQLEFKALQRELDDLKREFNPKIKQLGDEISDLRRQWRELNKELDKDTYFYPLYFTMMTLGKKNDRKREQIREKMNRIRIKANSLIDKKMDMQMEYVNRKDRIEGDIDSFDKSVNLYSEYKTYMEENVDKRTFVHINFEFPYAKWYQKDKKTSDYRRFYRRLMKNTLKDSQIAPIWKSTLYYPIKNYENNIHSLFGNAGYLGKDEKNRGKLGNIRVKNIPFLTENTVEGKFFRVIYENSNYFKDYVHNPLRFGTKIYEKAENVGERGELKTTLQKELNIIIDILLRSDNVGKRFELLLGMNMLRKLREYENKENLWMDLGVEYINDKIAQKRSIIETHNLHKNGEMYKELKSEIMVLRKKRNKMIGKLQRMRKLKSILLNKEMDKLGEVFAKDSLTFGKDKRMRRCSYDRSVESCVLLMCNTLRSVVIRQQEIADKEDVKIENKFEALISGNWQSKGEMSNGESLINAIEILRGAVNVYKRIDKSEYSIFHKIVADLQELCFIRKLHLAELEILK